MRLADKLAQCRVPFIVQDATSQASIRLNGAAEFAETVMRCPTRYVLTDDLTRLCTALAYSKGTRTLACTDLLHVPAELVWVEWCEAAWQGELALYGFRQGDNPWSGVSRCESGTGGCGPRLGRRGALIQSTKDGRRGVIRTFWSTGEANDDVLASSMEAYFDLDTEEGEEPVAPDAQNQATLRVCDGASADAGASFTGKVDVLRRCFRFRFERTWADYYDKATVSPVQKQALARHALGTIAIDIPVLLAFFLLMATRTGLPQRPQTLDRLNRSRAKSRKVPLLEHIEVLSPMATHDESESIGGLNVFRRRPRLHHVRGHLVRRGNQLFWRVPHLRGNARSGTIRTRTVTWTFERAPAVHPLVHASVSPLHPRPPQGHHSGPGASPL